MDFYVRLLKEAPVQSEGIFDIALPEESQIKNQSPVDQVLQYDFHCLLRVPATVKLERQIYKFIL